MTEPPSERPDFQPPGGSQPSQPPFGPSPAAPNPPPEATTPPLPRGPVPFTPQPPAWRVPEPTRGGGSILLGLAISLVCLAISAYGWLRGTDSPLGEALFYTAAVLPIGLLVTGLVLSSLTRTRRTGSGILIGFGLAVLVAGGLCIALLSAFS